MKKLFVLLVTCAQLANAQQDPLYSMYFLDKMLINPAFTGSSNWVAATLKYRDQFAGFNGHPSTKTFNIHSPIQKKHLGVGFKIISDKVAMLSNLTAAFDLSYHLNFAGGKLSAGIEGGLVNKKINYSDLVVTSLGDNALPTSNASSVLPDLSYGFYYQKKQVYVGFSQYHLLKKEYDYGTPQQGAHLFSHYYFIMGNVYQLHKNWTLEPSLLVKYVGGAKPQLDLNATAYYNDRFGAGLQYRTGDALVTFLKLAVSENFKIAYAYDLTLSKISHYARGSHEIILSYGIKLPPPPSQKEIHPRYYF